MLEHILTRFSDLLLRQYHKKKQDLDILVATRGGHMIFWPISTQAQKVLPELLRDAPRMRGGYGVPTHQWKTPYDEIHHNYFPRIGRYTPSGLLIIDTP